MATARAVIALGTVLGFERAPAQSFDQIYVFGDSLSDIGNVSDTTRGDIPQALLSRTLFQWSSLGRISCL